MSPGTAAGSAPSNDQRRTTPVRRTRTWRQRRARMLLRMRRQRVGIIIVAVALILSTTIGWAIGRASAPEPYEDVRALVETTLLPLAVDADGIWTSSSDDRDPISEALLALRRDDDPSLVELHAQSWLDAYDVVLLRIAGLDLPDAARAIQRQVIAGVTLSRDAVEVLSYASATRDGNVRQILTTEVGRLRQRSEQLIQSARAATSDLGGPRVDVSPLSDLTRLGTEP